VSVNTKKLLYRGEKQYLKSCRNANFPGTSLSLLVTNLSESSSPIVNFKLKLFIFCVKCSKAQICCIRCKI
jgi:hypothetical protein